MLCSRDARCRCKSSLSALIYRSSISRNSKRARCVRYASQRSMPFVVRLIARLAIFSNFVLTPPNQRSKDVKIGVPNKYRGYLQAARRSLLGKINTKNEMANLLLAISFCFASDAISLASNLLRATASIPCRDSGSPQSGSIPR